MRMGFRRARVLAQLLEWYGVEVSPTLISNVTEAVMDEVRQWQNRPLEDLYPIIYVDCLVIKVRENQRILNKAVYLVLGITLEGQKEPASACGSQKTKGPAFWLSVCTELRNRGMRRLLHCLRGWPHRVARGH
jgi:putative transposase